MADVEDPPLPVKPPRRRALDVLKSLSEPKVAVMLILGFGSGLPFMLIGNTLGFWLAESGVKLATIGFLSWVGLAYLIKFLWGAVVDRVPAPLLGRLGRRRGWILASQIGVAAGLIGMACAGFGKLNIAMLAGFAVFTGFAAAVQDTVIDAWRIESAADPDELGLLTAAYTLGYRAALIATESLILMVASRVGWALAYALYGVAMIVAVIAVLYAREPARADAVMEAKGTEAKTHPVKAFFDIVVGPRLEDGPADAGDDHPLSPQRLPTRADEQPLLQGAGALQGHGRDGAFDHRSGRFARRRRDGRDRVRAVWQQAHAHCRRHHAANRHRGVRAVGLAWQ